MESLADMFWKKLKRLNVNRRRRFLQRVYKDLHSGNGTYSKSLQHRMDGGLSVDDVTDFLAHVADQMDHYGMASHARKIRELYDISPSGDDYKRTVKGNAGKLEEMFYLSVRAEMRMNLIKKTNLIY